MPASGLKRIGEVAEILGTTPRALRFYEEQDLLRAYRTEGGTRLYSDEDILRLRAVLRLVDAGLPLDTVRALAAAREESASGAESSARVASLLQELAEYVRERRRQLDRLEAELAEASATVARCADCPNPPTRQGCPVCPANELTGTSALVSLIWEQRSGAEAAGE